MDQLKQNLKQLRSKNGWTQEELARRIHVSLSTVQRWECKGARPTHLARREIVKIFRRNGIVSTNEVKSKVNTKEEVAGG